jgi:hypothetical protein
MSHCTCWTLCYASVRRRSWLPLRTKQGVTWPYLLADSPPPAGPLRWLCDLTHQSMHCRLGYTISQAYADRICTCHECSAGGRDISTELDAHWQRHAMERFGQANANESSRSIGQLQSSSVQTSSHGIARNGSSMCHWRSEYERQAMEHAEKQQRVRDKVQRMFHAEKAAKEQRSAQVRMPWCCHGGALPMYRVACVTGTRSSRGGPILIMMLCCSGHRHAATSAQQRQECSSTVWCAGLRSALHPAVNPQEAGAGAWQAARPHASAAACNAWQR